MLKLSKRLYRVLLAVAFGLTAFGLPPLAPVQAALPQLPTLNWQNRSDWVNVKTSVTPGAVGDGVQDDTAAIQAALNKLSDTDGGLKVVYLPAGRYRITNTLTLTHILGALIVGNGQGTSLVWDGPVGGSMFYSNGVSRSRYIGLTWDGAGKAAVGIDHRSDNYYETRICHRDEAFLNFTEAGIRAGYNQVLPTAEVMYRNCLFQNDASGAEFIAWNDYNNDFAQCDFQDCGTAINCVLGNISARQCHFERSRESDISLCPHSHGIRRCTSIGSKHFMQVNATAQGCAVTVEDCHVDRWTGTDGAIILGSRGPVTVTDCTFTHPPNNAPPISLTNWATVLQTATLSNNAAPNSTGVINPGANSQVLQVPVGSHGPNLSDPTQTFIRTSESVSGRVLNVKTDFGAKGDNQTDDTAALRNAIIAAQSVGNGAVVYLPPGVYLVSATLTLSGSNYTFGGAGWGTVVQWVGTGAGPVVAVHDPNNVTMENMRIASPDAVCAVQQTSTNVASSMTYDGVVVGGSFLDGDKMPIVPTHTHRGLECIGLSASSLVHLIHFDGSLHFSDCSRATVLADFLVDGVLLIDGADYAKTGFLGVLTRDDYGNPCDTVVHDNQDLVMTNFYTEQTNAALSASGDGMLLGQPGHVTVQGSQISTNNPAGIMVNDYEGRVTYMGAYFGWGASYNITQTGTRPVDILLLNNMFWQAMPSLSTSTGAQTTMLGNIVISNGLTNATTIIPSQLPGVGPVLFSPTMLGSGNALIAATDTTAVFDDFRLLGLTDLSINHQLSVAAPDQTPTITNDSFENPSVGSAGYQYNPVGGNWNFTGYSGIQSNGSTWGGANAPDGMQTAFLQGTPNTSNATLGSISQSVNFIAAGTYVITFQAARRLGQIQPLQFSVDGVNIGMPITPADCSFQSYVTNSFTIKTAGSHTIKVTACANTSDLTVFIDKIGLSSVNPPNALANGSFEMPSVGSASYQYNLLGGAWFFTGDSGIQSNSSVWGVANATDGTQTAFLQGYPGQTLGSISQSVNFTATGNFVLRFQGARRQGQAQPVQVSVDGVPVSGLLTPAGNSFALLTTIPFAINTPGVHTITLAATNNSADLSTMVDQVVISQVSGTVAPIANA